MAVQALALFRNRRWTDWAIGPAGTAAAALGVVRFLLWAIWRVPASTWSAELGTLLPSVLLAALSAVRRRWLSQRMAGSAHLNGLHAD